MSMDCFLGICTWFVLLCYLEHNYIHSLAISSHTKYLMMLNKAYQCMCVLSERYADDLVSTIAILPKSFQVKKTMYYLYYYRGYFLMFKIILRDNFL